MNILLGDKFYKYIKEKDEIYQIQISKIKNQDKHTGKFTAIELENNNKISITKEELLENYTRLQPDGYISFSVVELANNIKDVIVSLFRTKDISNHEALPYCVCRQQITNLFANQLKYNNDIYIGMSISKDTIPPDVPYEAMVACNKIYNMIMVSYYIEDSGLDDILKFVKEEKYDEILRTIKPKEVTIDNNGNKILGHCVSLRELLINNYFVDDVYDGFNIIKIPCKMELVNEFELDSEICMYLENEIHSRILQTYVLKYDKEINLKEIKRNYVLVLDDLSNLYVVAYDKGEYINRNYNKINDKRDVALLWKHRNKINNQTKK